jgi:hypothetical protein
MQQVLARLRLAIRFDVPIAWTALGAALGAAALLATATGAAAQQPSQAQANAIRSACRSDYQSHCASVPTGGSAALQCLQQNAASVSQPCQQALAAVSGGAPNASASTGAAAPSAGSGAPAGGAAPSYGASMAQPRPQLTPREQMALLRADCAPDYRRLCRGVPIGGGRAIECLKANGPNLSPRCQSVLLAAKQSR